MYLEAVGSSIGSVVSIVTTCPVCSKGGTLVPFSNIPDCRINNRQNEAFVAGQRKCPNPSCSAHIFFLRAPDGATVFYPKLRIEFNAESIPAQIRSSFDEVVTCHAEGCYVASAIMVRRTLEELCEDKGCTGSNLFQRIEALKNSVVLPQELFAALDELRLLGNDAAHLESKSYDNIGEEELSVAIELTKEILKSVYQMEGLVNRLRKLKKS